MSVKGHNKERLPEWPHAVMGGKYVRMLDRHLRALRDEQAHGNRRLFLDDAVVAYLLAFFNPTLRSLRTLEDFSQTRQAQRHLSLHRLCKSTLSDFNRLADPTVLEPVITKLQAAIRARKSAATLEGLPHMLSQVLAVDGSFFTVAADVAWAVRRGTNSGRRLASARLDVHLDVATWLPEIVDVSGHDQSEAQHAARSIKPGAIHLYDRGIFSFELIAAQQKAGAFFVHRVREAGARCPQFVATQTRALTVEDQHRGVVRDAVGHFAGSTHCAPPQALLREVVLESPDQPGGVIRLITNLWEVEAWTLGELYRSRWQVELFFRWLKVFANFEHLISESREGILLNFYVALIGVMLMYLHTQAKPSKYAFSLLAQVACGGATLEEIAPILKERERRIALERARVARKKQIG